MVPSDAESSGSPERGGQLLRNLALGALAFLVLAVGVAWVTREQIASNVIDSILADNGIEASYEIAEIGPQRQVLENLIIGDPAAPDLTIERVVIDASASLFSSALGSARIEKPRLFGSYREGVLSFGSLDPLLFAESEEPSALPAIDLTVVDGGALLETDFGDVGAYLEGSGRLDDGFAGKLALTAPGIAAEGCSAESLTAFGDLIIETGAPRFAGPIRLANAECAGATLDRADVMATLATGDDFSSLSGDLGLDIGRLGYGENSVEGLGGQVSLSLREDGLTLDHDVTAARLASRYGVLTNLTADGALRSDAGYERNDWNASITGEGGDFFDGANGALADAKLASEGTLLAPLLGKLERNLAASLRKGTLAGEAAWRSSKDGQTLAVPEARLRNESGETVIALSRLNWAQRTGETGLLRGNVLTGGAGLPQINGRMEQVDGGPLALRMTMAEYSAGDSRIAVPNLQVRQQPGGAVQFAGSVRASGAIPGGSIAGLSMPVNGSWSQASGVTLGRSCQTIRFDGLAYYDLALRSKEARLCPVAGRPMLAYDDSLRFEAQTQEIALAGELAESPTTISVQHATLRYPGPFVLEDLAAKIGPEDNSVYLSAASLEGALDSEIGGSFAGGEARLDVVPLDLGSLSGKWSYEDEVLRIADASFILTERIDGRPRFEPLSSNGAVLSLNNNVIEALGTLRHPDTQSEVLDVAVRHDLASGEGGALIGVDRLTFGEGLELQDLTYLVLGVIAQTKGTITGQGQINWTFDDITSSGAFSTDGLDLAAAFGPIRQLRGTVRFSDLVNLTTEPGQLIEIGSINPGVEVIAGKVRFSMTDGEIIAIEDGRWPFMGGELIVRPTTLRYGTDDPQRYTFEVIGLDAATFVTEMELANIGATGTFDGTVPITFDSQGNGRIEQGLLISRSPGGNVSYIGELTYEDLGAVSNYAFESLRSLDYTQMRIELDGNLAGEIITRFGIDGVRQGASASQNFVTRQLAQLPIRFNINVRSENFYQLATMVRSFVDPEVLSQEVAKRVLNQPNMQVGPPPQPNEPEPGSDPAPPADALRPDEPTVQPPESDTLP